MTTFHAQVSAFMSTPVHSVPLDATAIEVDRALEQHGISATGVVDASGALVGVLSRTDLLQSASGVSGQTFELAKSTAAELMTPDPITVSDDTSLEATARVFVKKRIHRVFVERDGQTVGVLSTRDLMRAVMEKRVRTPAIEIATRSIVRVEASDSLALAVDRLDVSNKHGLVVVDEGWPVGTFSQNDALLARARDPRTRIDEVMNLRVLSLPPSIPIHRAAAQALALGVRRILLVDEREIAGVLSTFDFARVVR